MTFKLYTLLLFILAPLLVLAQSKQSFKHLQKHERHLKQDNHLPNTFIIKLNLDGEKAFNPLTEKSSLLDSLQIRVLKVQHLFPQEKNQTPAKDEFSISLSRIYQVTYQGKTSLEQVLEILSNSIYLEYAEPYFINKTMLVPNEPAIANNDLFYLERYQAYEAWDETQGDTNVVIAIIDTGVRSTLADLKDNLKYNAIEAAGLPGVDDDGDGYIDNIIGWDFGNNDNNPDASTNGHGTVVAGIASATPNNGIGTVGTGYNCKYMPIKVSADANGGNITFGFQGLYYAATHGCHVANLSWGSPGGYSQTAQDVINFAVLTKNMIVVAAAGNSAKEENFYPASYDNVLSVASSDTMYSASANKVIDIKASAATYSYHVDLCAQGRAVYSTENNGTYSKTPGSSNAAPQVSGAAALLRSKFPSLTAQQIMQQLRITGDIIDTFPENKAYKEKIGRRLNMYKALTDTTTPSVRVTASSFKSNFGENLFSGDTVRLTLDFINYLYPTTNCKVTVSSPSPYIEFLDNTTYLGTIPTLGNTNNNADPITMVIKKTSSFDLRIPFRVQFDDVDYYDYQHFTYTINPSWLTIKNNETALTVSGNGRLGYIDNNNTTGDGFTYQNNYMIFEAGLMLATSSSKVSDCVRGDLGILETDFKNTMTARYTDPIHADIESKSSFDDSAAKSPIGITVYQNNYAWNSPTDSRYQIIEYIFENKSGAKIDTLLAGIYTDWDIMDAEKNKTGWNYSRNLGYAYSTQQNGLVGGIRLLTNQAPTYFAMDHDQSMGGDNIFPNDSFTSEEKYNTMKNGIARIHAGATGNGRDISSVVGAQILNLLPNEKRKVAFAIIGSPTLATLYKDADAALEKYKSFNTGQVPELANINLCQGQTTDFTIKPDNGTNFNFYKKYPGIPFHKGAELFVENQSASDTLYITNTDSIFESSAKEIQIIFREKPLADFTANPESLNLAQQTEVRLTSTNNPMYNYNWSFGDGENSIDLSPTHTYYNTGNYTIQLTISDEYGCEDSKNISYSVIYDMATNVQEVFAGENIKIFPIPTEQVLHVEFNESKNYQIRVINSIGVQLYSQKETGFGSKIDTQQWQSGVYHLIIDAVGNTYTKTIIKK
jgi:serine protease